MAKHLFATSILIYCTAFACSARGDDDPNVAQMRKLYSKIAESVSVNQNVARPGSTYLVLASPGILLDPTLDVDGNVQDRVLLDSLVEKSMDADWIYRPKNELTSEIYRRILTFHQAPIFKLDVASQADLDKINKEIFTISSDGTRTYTTAWNQFTDLRAKYANAIDDAQTWMNNNPGKLLPASKANALKLAKDSFLTLGDGTRRATILQRKREIEAFDPESWWAELQGFFDGNVDDVGSRPYPRDLFYPKYKTWNDTNAQWTTINISQTDFERTTTNNITSTGGGLGANWGLWRVNVGASGTTAGTHLDVNFSSITLSFQVLRVNIERPWMDPMVFYSQAWQWGCGTQDKPIVSGGGDPAKGQQLTGLMPFLPTGILIAKSLSIRADLSKGVQDTINSTSSGGGGISFGPFRLGGHRAESNSREYVSTKATGTGVDFKEPQIIGYFVEVLPTSPNPLPSLKFAACQDATPQPAPNSNLLTGNLDPHSLSIIQKRLELLEAK